MKKLFIFGLTVCCVLISRCTRSEDFVRMAFTPGTTYHYTIATTRVLTQTMMGETVELTQTLTWHYVFRIVDVDERSIATIDILYDEIGLETRGPFGSIEYRSWDYEGEIPQSVQAFTVLLDKHVTMKLSPYGEVLSVTGTESFIDEMIEALGVSGDTARIIKARNDLANQFGNRAITESFRKIFPIFPRQSIGIGDAWGVQLRFTRGLPVIVRNTWHVHAVGENMLVLDAYGTIEPNPEVRFMNMPGTEMHYHLRGQKKGEYTIDRANGWIVHGRIQQDIEGVVAISGMVNSERQSAQWPLQVQESIEISVRE